MGLIFQQNHTNVPTQLREKNKIQVLFEIITALKLLNVDQRMNQQHKKKIRNTKESKRKREKSLSLAAELQRLHLELLMDQPKNNERKYPLTSCWGGVGMGCLKCSDALCLVCSHRRSWYLWVLLCRGVEAVHDLLMGPAGSWYLLQIQGGVWHCRAWRAYFCSHHAHANSTVI